MNSPHNLSKEQLRELTSKLLDDGSFPLTAEKFNQIVEQFQPAEGAKGEAAPEESQLPFSMSARNKLQKIYNPYDQSPPNLETLLHKISQAPEQSNQSELSTQIYELILAHKFLPHQNVVRLKNAFDEMNICLSDDLNSIFDGLKQLALNFQNSIATTINFSNLRPKLSLIRSTQGVSAGPVSFIRIFASTFEALRQNIQGESTATQTIILNIHHPDILEYLIFIKNFQKNSSNRHFLFLIDLTPAFLEALERNDDFELINPQNQQVINYLSSKNTFNLIVSTIQENTQLGLIQTTPSSRNQNTDQQISISGTLNLAEYYTAAEVPKEDGNKSKLRQLDLTNLHTDLLHIEKYLQNQKTQLAKSQDYPVNVRLFLTGFADLLIRLHISQTSVQSLEIIEQITQAFKSSLSPAIEVGASLTSPLSGLFDSSRGLEIYESLYTSRSNVDGQETFTIITPLRQTLEELGSDKPELVHQITQTHSLQSHTQLPQEIRNLFFTSKELSTEFHLNLQKLFQSHLTGTIDKKIIFENGLDLEQTKEIIISYLRQGLRTIRFCSFEPLLPMIETEPHSSTDNFLLNTYKMKKRQHQQIQPPLFQIKKTEEIIIPPLRQQTQN